MSERRLFANEIEARLDELLLLSLRQRSGHAAAIKLEGLSRDAQEVVFHWVGVVAQTSTDLGLLIADHAAEHPLGFDAWVKGGLAAFDHGGLKAAERALFNARPESPSNRLSYADVADRLSGFLHALEGRPPTVRMGKAAYTDGEAFWLPQSLENLADAERHWACYKCMAALLWAQTRFGSFDVDIEPEVARWPDRQRALGWLSLLEAMRLEACLARELPGLAAEMADLRGPWSADLLEAASMLARPEATVTDSLRWMAVLLDQTQRTPPNLAYGALLDPGAVRRRLAHAALAGEHVIRAPLKLLRGVGGQANTENDSLPVPLLSEADAALADAEAGVLVESAKPESGKADETQAMAPPAEGTTGPAGPGIWSPTSGTASPVALPIERAPDARYDEWDYRRQAWRRDWCHLFEHDADQGPSDWVAEVGVRYAHQIRSVRRRFEILRGENVVHGRQPDGEDIDLEACVAAYADRKSGGDASLRLYRQRQRTERSVAVMFMVDMSGSTKGWVNEAERESLVMLCEAIEALGDRYAIYGFSGWTRTRCDIYRIKRFDEPYDRDVRCRIAGIDAKDYTRMGVAVRHLSALLRGQSARHKLLFTLSDGRPDDYGDEYRGRYGIEDTRCALLEARAKGIRSFCITIDRQGADYLPQLYGPSHFAVIDDAKKLPQKIADVYRRLTS